MAKQFPLKKGGKPAGKPAKMSPVAPAKPDKGTNMTPDTGPASGLLGKASSKLGAVHPDNVLKNLKIDPQLSQGFIGGVKSVMQFVTDPKTHQLFLKELEGPGPASQKIAEAAEDILQIVIKHSNKQFPLQMYMPVGIYMVSWIADFVQRAKLLPVTEKDVALAMQMFIHSTVTGIQAAQQGGGLVGAAQQGAGQQQPPAGAAPPAGPAAPGPQPGPALPKMAIAPAQAPGTNPNLGPGPAPGPAMQPLAGRMG